MITRDEAMNLNKGWYMVLHDPSMPTDFWTPNPEISYIIPNRGENRNELWDILEWRPHADKEHRIDGGIICVYGEHMFKWLKLKKCPINIFSNPHSEEIHKWYWDNWKW